VRASGRSSIHVVMAIQTFSPTIGGAELQLERLLPYLAARGVTADVFTRAVTGHPSTESIPGGTVHRTRLSGQSAAASVAYVASSLGRILKQRPQIDVVHAHGALSPATIALGARTLGLPSLVTVLGAGRRGDLARLVTKPGGRWRLRMLSRRVWFIALSDSIKRELVETGVREERIFVVPNGVDLRTYRPATAEERASLRSQLGIPPGEFVAAFVGRLHPIKGLDRLLLAAADTSDVRLVVLGDGSERDRLSSLSHRLGIDDRVRFVGATDHVADYLRASDCFLLPSEGEGLSNALIEAMCCGLPSIAMAGAGGVQELLSGGRGLALPVGSVHAWSEAMTRLARDPGLRAQLGDAAARFTQARLSMDSVADRMVEVYRALRLHRARGQTTCDD
jgi:glycosyltransferase involved in cell wall biosynthesis